MRRVIAIALLVLGCSRSDMPQDLKVKIRGLWTSPNEHGEIPQGALSRADDIVLTRDGVAEKRRGQPTRLQAPAAAMFPYRGRLLVQAGSTLSISDDEVTTLTPFVGSFDPVSGRKMHAAEANGNLYFSTAAGIKRLSSEGGTPVDAGVPAGLDVQATTTGTAGFLPADSAVAYRVVWGERDANNNLMLGAPSGRVVVGNGNTTSRDVNVSTSIPPGVDPARHFWQLYRSQPSVGVTVDPGDEMGLVYEGPAPQPASVTQLSRASNVVTATTSAPHGFTAGQIVRVSPGGSVGSLAAVGTSSVAATSSDGSTWIPRTIPAGSYLGSASSGAVVVAVGTNVAASSADGITWTARTIPAGDYRGVVWTGSLFVAVGWGGACATSPDGTTWTARSIPQDAYSGIAWSGSTLVAIGNENFSTSPDGVAWTSRPLVGVSNPRAILWTGKLFVAAGAGTSAATSPDGVSWTSRAMPASMVQIYGLATNGSVIVAVGSGNGVPTVATSPDGTVWTARDTSGTGAMSLLAVAWTGSNFVAVGTSNGAISTNGVAWSGITTATGAYRSLVVTGTSFLAGEKTISSVPTAASFTYAEFGSNGEMSQPQTATPLTAFVVDTIPSTFSGATLYTSPSQDGLLAAQYDPPIARDLAVFRGSMLWLGTTTRASLQAWLLAVDTSGASSGVRDGDTITINGMTFTASSAENVSGRTFQRYTTGTPSQNVANTAGSLVRVVNRAQGSPVTCRDMSAANDTPGQLRIEARTRTDSITVSVSRAGSWSFTNGQTASAESHGNEIRWSPANKPDAAPVSNYQRIGSSDKDGLRVLPLRDSALVIKTDGIWRLAGDNASWSISPLDTTTEMVGPETIVTLDNLAFGLSTKGVVQISDQGGVTILSRPIDDQIRPLLVEPMLSTVRAVAHGVANEAEGKYYLWVPEVVGGKATKAFVYDHYASLAAGEPVWTVRTDDADCGIVNPADGRLYTGTATAIHRERKDFGPTDYADEELPVTVSLDVTSNTIQLASISGIEPGDVVAQGVVWGIVLSVDEGRGTVFLDRGVTFTAGAAMAYKAIPSVIEFAPIIPAPGGTVQFSEATLLFRSLAGARMTEEFATELAPTYVGVEFDGVAMGINQRADVVNLRTWVPRDQQRASRLSVRFTHRQAWCPMALEGASILYRPVSTRLRR